MGMLDAAAGAQMFVSVWSHVGGLLSGVVVGIVRLTGGVMLLTRLPSAG